MWFRLRSSLFVTILPFLDAFFHILPYVLRKLDRQRIGRAVFSSLFFWRFLHRIIPWKRVLVKIRRQWSHLRPAAFFWKKAYSLWTFVYFVVLCCCRSINVGKYRGRLVLWPERKNRQHSGLSSGSCRRSWHRYRLPARSTRARIWCTKSWSEKLTSTPKAFLSE